MNRVPVIDRLRSKGDATESAVVEGCLKKASASSFQVSCLRAVILGIISKKLNAFRAIRVTRLKKA